MMSIKGKKPLLTNLGIALLSIFLCLAAFETALRVRHAFSNLKLNNRLGMEMCTRVSEDPRLIYEYTPGKCANKYGFLDYDYDLRKGDGIFRIIVIGDSIAQGQYVKLEESFGKVLERKLNGTGTNRKYEVIIMAVPGYSTSQELVLLEDKALQSDPDLIIWSYCLNDPAHPIYHNANGEYGRYYYRPGWYIQFFIEKRMFFLNERKRGRNCGSEFHELLHCVYRDQVESNIFKIRSLTRQKHVPVIFLLHPVFEKDSNFANYSLTALHRRLRDVASRAGLITLDILDAYKPYSSEELRIHSEWYDPWHPNARGHLIIAGYLYNKFAENNIAGVSYDRPTLKNRPVHHADQAEK